MDLYDMPCSESPVSMAVFHDRAHAAPVEPRRVLRRLVLLGAPRPVVKITDVMTTLHGWPPPPGEKFVLGEPRSKKPALRFMKYCLVSRDL